MNKKERILKNLRLIIITSLVSVVYVLLISPIILNLQFIKNFLNCTSIKLFVGITAIILIVLIWTWEKANKLWQRYKNTKGTKKFPLTYIIIIGLYLLITVCMGVAFLSVATSKEFRCFLILNFVFFIIWFFSSYFWKVKLAKKEDLKSMDSLFDEPITTHEEDILRREKFVKDLCRVIEGLPTNIKSSSFTLGLHGCWGEGKTSVINLLVDKLKGNDQFLIIRFEPWHFKEGEAILKSFYTQIEKEILDKYIFPAFKRTISRYQKAISTGISLPGFNLALNPSDQSMDGLKEKIESYINQIGKKLLIIIDDIDRLQPEEISLIFKLIRKNANFKNTIFLLSFDQEIVKNSLKANCDTDPDFLEKIVQMPISLPAIEQNSIDAFLFSEIEKLLKTLDLTVDEIETIKNPFSTIYRTELRKLFKTLRLVKRYINGLKATLPSIKHEVNIYDFLILEIIRVFNLKLYEDIWEKKWIYITSFDGMLSAPFSIMTKEEEIQKVIRNHIDKLLENHPNKEIFEKLLAELFPDQVRGALSETAAKTIFGETDRVEKRICHSDCFYKYFARQVTPTEISDY